MLRMILGPKRERKRQESGNIASYVSLFAPISRCYLVDQVQEVEQERDCDRD
jgi:hypothetical protein